jgi:ABC-2 type transport system ATP-binding protein
MGPARGRRLEAVASASLPADRAGIPDLAASVAPVIEVAGLTKRFGRLTAVDELDLVLRAGEVYGLLGPNGAGKTTTIRCLLGYLHPTHGQTRVLGGPARDPGIRRRIGYLPGDLRMEGRMKVAAILDFYADLRGGVDRRRIDALCEQLQLDRSRPFGQLSKGNRQKVGVVQAFMHEPDVLVLDEPTSGLDPLMQREVLSLVRERRDAGAAVLFSSHLIFEVEEVADRVGILRQGRKVVEDTVGGLQVLTARQSLHLRFTEPVPASAFEGIPGVESVQVERTRVAVVVRGSIAPLVRALADLPIEHIAADPILLDDLFYGIYDGQGPAGDRPRTEGEEA